MSNFNCRAQHWSQSLISGILGLLGKPSNCGRQASTQHCSLGLLIGTRIKYNLQGKQESSIHHNPMKTFRGNTWPVCTFHIICNTRLQLSIFCSMMWWQSLEHHPLKIKKEKKEICSRVMALFMSMMVSSVLSRPQSMQWFPLLSCIDYKLLEKYQLLRTLGFIVTDGTNLWPDRLVQNN